MSNTTKRVCDDCGKTVGGSDRRRRCLHCRALVCHFCFYHKIHSRSPNYSCHAGSVEEYIAEHGHHPLDRPIEKCYSAFHD